MSARKARAGLRKRSLTIAGHRTSISLEDAFWDGLQAIAEREARSLAALVSDVDGRRGEANLSSAVRVFVLDAVRGETGGASELTGGVAGPGGPAAPA